MASKKLIVSGWCRFAEPSVELATEWTVDVELVRRIQASDRRGTPSPLALGSQASQQRVVPIFPRGEAAASRKDHSGHIILPYTDQSRMKALAPFTKFGLLKSPLGPWG